ncbi:MAG: hypothetical protein K9K88_08115 [Desulfobacterales bacterium]|nr:hypothetical protein [Desulfobacterales bacterium]
MRQKFIVRKNDGGQMLIVQEYAELDKDILSFICEERYPLGQIEQAMQGGREALIARLRTDNMYPPILYAQAIADLVMAQLTEGEDDRQELVFDDSNYIAKDLQAPLEESELKDEESDIDELLDEDLEDEYDDKKIMKDFKSSIQIADDDSLDVDEEN